MKVLRAVVTGERYYFLKDVREMIGHAINSRKTDMKDDEFLAAHRLELHEHYNVATVDKAGKWTLSELTVATSNRWHRYIILCDWVDNYGKDNGVPPIINLTYHEQFKNLRNQVVNIEVRGERGKENEMYFSVDDLVKNLGMKNLKNSLLRNSTKYEENIHYHVFEIDGKNKLFLNHKGYIQALMNSKAENVQKYRDWASTTLKISRFGTKEDREQLIADICGLSGAEIKKLFSAMPKVSGFYMFFISMVGDCRDLFNIPDENTSWNSADNVIRDEGFRDDMFVTKIGYSVDIYDRYLDHKKDFQENNGLKTMLKCFFPIPPSLMKDAEQTAIEYFRSIGAMLIHEKREELCILSKDQFSVIKTTLAGPLEKYISHNATTLAIEELNSQAKTLKHDIEQLEDKHMYMLALEQAQKEALQTKLGNMTQVSDMKEEAAQQKMEIANLKYAAALKEVKDENEKLKRLLAKKK